MPYDEKDLLTDIERQLKNRFAAKTPEENTRSFVSNAVRDPKKPKAEARMEQLVVPDEQRAKLPLTKEKFLVKESPLLIFWERETRKFLRKLSPDHGHRVSAVMVYEWATGLPVKELEESIQGKPSPQKAPWRADLRTINKILRHYFGNAKKARIAGHDIPRAYTVKPGTYITRKRPMTLELYAAYCEGTLVP